MKWFGVLALVAASGALLTILVWRSAAGSAVEGPTRVRVELGASRTIEGIGYVEPLSEVRQLSPKMGGVIKACYVKVGDVVRKGDPILNLHDEKEAAAVVLARTQLEVARAEESQVKSGIHPNRIVAAEKTVARLKEQHTFASQEVERHRQLIDGGGVSRSKLEQDESTKRDLEAAIKHAEAELMHLKTYVRDVDEMLMKAKVGHAAANLALAEQQQRDLCVLAPFDGTVLKLLKRPGEGVRMIELEPVVLFGDLSRLRVRAEIDERFVKDLSVGQDAEVYGRNLLGKRYPGKVVEIEKIMGDKTVFTRASSERKALNVLQVVIEMEVGFTAPMGLQVDVRIQPARGK